MTVPGADSKEISKQIVNRINEARGDDGTKLSLSPFKDLHLYGLTPGRGRIASIILFGMLGLAILLIACMNFMNLATARSATRAREIGLRKVVGASRGNIIMQFYGEAFAISFLALLVSFVLVELTLPFFNNLIMRELTFDLFTELRVPLAAIGVTILTALIAGSYPALFMASFRPVVIFRGSFGKSKFKSRFRKGLVVWQYAVSIILIIFTAVIYKQLGFLQVADVGFDRTNLVYVPLRGETKTHYLTFKEQVQTHSAVQNATLISRLPTGVWTNGSGWMWEGKNSETDPLVTFYFTDEDFDQTFNIQILEGRFFTAEQYDGASYIHGDILVNETFAKTIADENVVGMTINNYGLDYRIVGIVNDFKFKSLHYSVDPLIIYQKGGTEKYPMRFEYLCLKIDPDQVEGFLGHLEETALSLEPDVPVEYGFLDDKYKLMYGGIERFGNVIWGAAFMMIFISCLGLFGLAAYTTEQRNAEVGIRKVLGASEMGIVRLLSWDILRPILYACIAGSALSYIWISGWLMSQFAFSTSIGWEPFVLANGLAIGVAFLSVSFQALRAAHCNPADILRHE